MIIQAGSSNEIWPGLMTTQLSARSGLAAQSNTLFVANSGSGTVGKRREKLGQEIEDNLTPFLASGTRSARPQFVRGFIYDY